MNSTIQTQSKKVFYKTLFICTILTQTHFLFSQFNDCRMFAFGHSLIDHRPPAIPTPSDETTIAHWMYLIANEAGKDFSMGGQYGFIPSHANLPPFSQWGYDIVPGVWDSDNDSFGEAQINTILITAANFIQYQAPQLEHPIDNSTTVIESTETIFDWVTTQQEDTRFYIYGNWPEMDLQNAYPPNLPNEDEINDYHEITINEFSDWWIDYQDLMMISRPAYHTRLIPVGQIISKMLVNQSILQIPFDELYEDSDPHGRASLYFLAGMISYMAIYEEKIPESYVPGDIVHQSIRDGLAQLTDFIWQELNAFNFNDGSSRVFYGTTNSTEDVSIKLEPYLYPNPNNGRFYINNNLRSQHIKIYKSNGEEIILDKTETTELDLTNYENGIYFIKYFDEGNNEILTQKMVKIH